MTIGIDIRVLSGRAKSGIEEYTENLLAHMLPLDKSLKFKLFYSSFSQELNSYDWLLEPNVEVHKFKIPSKVLFFSANAFKLPKIDQLLGGVDVFFSPHFFIAPLSKACKRVTTFHDLSYVQFPEFLSVRKNIWHNFEMKPAKQSRFSDRIIAVSESTKSDLIKIYGIDPAKIEVIHSGVAPSIYRPSEEQLQDFKKVNNLPDKFILYLGKFEPRKNIIGIIKAFNIIKSGGKFSDLKLILAGSRGWLYKDIFKEFSKSDHKDSIILKDHIIDKERSFYYSLASVFVYPSFFEGFGFPPLEAMVCGIPVITSYNTSLPEVVGRGGILLDPHNINDLASSMAMILDNKELSSQFVSLGIAQAGKFNWHSTAEKTLECLLEALL